MESEVHFRSVTRALTSKLMLLGFILYNRIRQTLRLKWETVATIQLLNWSQLFLIQILQLRAPSLGAPWVVLELKLGLKDNDPCCHPASWHPRVRNVMWQWRARLPWQCDTLPTVVITPGWPLIGQFHLSWPNTGLWLVNSQDWWGAVSLGHWHW